MGGSRDNSNLLTAPPPSAEMAFPEDLRKILLEFEDYLEAAIDDFSLEIKKRNPSPEEEEAAILWKLRMSEKSEGYIIRGDPYHALLDVWALCVRVRNFLETGLGSSLFGANQELAIDAAYRIERRIEMLARTHVPGERFVKTRDFVHSYADENPLRGMFLEQETSPLSLQQLGKEAVDFLIGIPLTPFRAISKVGDAADSFHEFNAIASQFTRVVEGLPEKSRWQLQLLVLDLMRNEKLTTTVLALDRVAKTSERVADMGERMPEELRETADRLFDRVDQSQPGLRATLTETRETLAQAGELSVSAERILNNATEAGHAWKETALAVDIAARSLAAIGASDKPPDEPRSRPFDITEYQRTAESATVLARDLETVLARLQAILESKSLPENIELANLRYQQGVTTAGKEVRELMDHLTLRAAQLMILLFVLVVIGKWLSRRFAHPAKRDTR
jgi:hypothetical protein